MGTELGRVGVWTFVLDRLPIGQAREMAAELEDLGYGAIWVPEALGRDALVNAALLLGGTQRCVVATGIASIYARTPSAMASGWKTVTEAFPDRFLLGLGVSHQPMVEGIHHQTYGPPLETMRRYLEAMDATPSFAAEPTSVPERVLAALGPRMLALAGAQARGAHPYLVPPEHTAQARTALGPGPLLAPEQMVVLDTDADRARRAARDALRIYLPGLPNYVNNLRRLGFTDDDFAAPLSDRIVDAVVAWGDEEAIRARVQAHHDAGADHVCVQVLPGDDAARVAADYRRLAPALIA
ncbi:MAG TPA: TIGR03620 family F420-dependent LLM class oxidoreductase [Acidimicrobiia bacterium]|nr:TIGR03620 family F420-dependent LLM class oxidoreductase [Acidimicrobiia bacterium]